MKHKRSVAVLVAAALVLAACSSGSSESSESTAATTTVPTAPAPFEVHPGVELVTVTGARAGAHLTLVDARGERLVTLVADDAGQAHFAYVPEEYAEIETGPDATPPESRGNVLESGEYTIRDETADPVEATEPFTVAARDDLPDESLYEGQEIGDGFGYVEMRDGVKLSVMVRLPDEALWGEGPYPTVIEYSGYGPSNPNETEPGSMIANLLGFATVGVNMRGSGCSGGVFDVFSPAQQADGYDVIEAIARQPWVLNNQVGMVGLSYSGISQLYVASSRPPSLAAITPLSVIEDAWQQQFPGGIYNSGFTRQWLAERDRQAAPDGMSWVQEVIDGGDTTCGDNLVLRSQNPDFESLFGGLEFRPADADARDLGELVRDIEVPVYLTGAFQDEQTGNRFADMLDHFDSTEHERFILYNGRHPDGFSPLVLSRWLEFLQFYVAGRVPEVPPLARALASAMFEDEFGAPGTTFEPDRFTSYGDDYEAALAAYEAEPPVRVLFESGAGGEVPGAPQATFEASFDRWPPDEAEARTWYLGGGGSLLDEAPSEETVGSYEHDPEAGERTFLAGDYDLMAPVWEFDWQPIADGKGLSYVSEPFAADTVVAGPGYATLWFSSEADDANVQVNVSEVREDGVEYLVQTGQLRLGHRKVDEEASDEFRVEYSYAESDYEPLPEGELVEAKIAIPAFAHPFRAGSRLRITVTTPGGHHAIWLFDNSAFDDAAPEHRVASGGEHPSSVLLAVLPSLEVPDEVPPCPALRGQACREYAPFDNREAT